MGEITQGAMLTHTHTHTHRNRGRNPHALISRSRHLYNDLQWAVRSRRQREQQREGAVFPTVFAWPKTQGPSVVSTFPHTHSPIVLHIAFKSTKQAPRTPASIPLNPLRHHENTQAPTVPFSLLPFSFSLLYPSILSFLTVFLLSIYLSLSLNLIFSVSLFHAHSFLSYSRSLSHTHTHMQP